MAHELALPDSRNIIDKHAEDIAELKRRARSSAAPDAPPDCCAEYCCADAPGEVLSIGETFTFCTFVPDPVGGQGLRLSVDGWARFSVRANGIAAISLSVRLNGTMYVTHPRHRATLSTDDEFTLPYGWTIDSPVADPTLTVEAQNIGAVDMRLDQCYGLLTAKPEDGSITCGVAGSG